MHVYITSKLLYGLETLELTQGAAQLLNKFQLKGLRKILNLQTTYVQRENTNELVYSTANEALNAPTAGPFRKVKPMTEKLEERKLKLLGHVLRRERQHPQHQVTFSTTSAMPRETTNRRVGRPRPCWTTNNMKKAWDIMCINNQAQPRQHFNKYNRNIREQLIAQAK